MAEHEHTDVCADMSRYVLVQVRATVLRGGHTNVVVSMKPGGSCWSDLDRVAQVTLKVPSRFPTSPEMAAEVAVDAIRAAYPGLF